MKRLLLLLTCVLVVCALVACVGTAGPQGIQGEKGEQGIQGLPGEDGKNGVDGANGKDGAPGVNGITPNLKMIDCDIWVSYDEGDNWELLGCINYINGKHAYSEGLEYELSDDKTYYSVVGMGACTDTDIKIPNIYNNLPVKRIGESAFNYSYNIESITIPGSVTDIDIDKYALAKCYSLTSIEVSDDNQHYKSIDGNLYTKDGKTLVQYAIGKKDSVFTVPDGVTSIGEYAFFHCKTINSVIIPNSVTSIGELAFCSCNNLYLIDISSSVAVIGERAFIYCYNLLNISVNEDSQYYKSIDGNLYTKDGKTLVQYALAKSDTFFAIPDGVTTISGYALLCCNNLTNITIPSSVSSIGISAFDGCAKLTSIIVDVDNEYYKSIDGNLYTKDGKTLVQYAIGKTDVLFIIPDGVTSLGYSSFAACENLSGIVIPKSVTDIESLRVYITDSLNSVYYVGTESEWNNINIDNPYFAKATRYYYSETEPTVSGNYWHYVDGKVVVW